MIYGLYISSMYVYIDDMYYLEDEDTIVIVNREDGCVHIYDVVSLAPINIDSIIENLRKRVEILKTPYLLEITHYGI